MCAFSDPVTDEYWKRERKQSKKNDLWLDGDGILKLLPAETTVMHDHNRVNYNSDYSFSNIECKVHLLRDLQKRTERITINIMGKTSAHSF